MVACEQGRKHPAYPLEAGRSLGRGGGPWDEEPKWETPLAALDFSQSFPTPSQKEAVGTPLPVLDLTVEIERKLQERRERPTSL